MAGDFAIGGGAATGGEAAPTRSHKEPIWTGQLVLLLLTVSFGLGLSATIHFLNRLRLESKPGVSSELAVERATVLVGPALILTTVVLACGLVVTVFSDLPSLRLFGWLSAFSMVAALVADLFILRPTAMFLINLAEKIRGTASQPKPAE